MPYVGPAEAPRTNAGGSEGSLGRQMGEKNINGNINQFFIIIEGTILRTIKIRNSVCRLVGNSR